MFTWPKAQAAQQIKAKDNNHDFCIICLCPESMVSIMTASNKVSIGLKGNLMNEEGLGSTKRVSLARALGQEVLPSLVDTI